MKRRILAVVCWTAVILFLILNLVWLYWWQVCLKPFQMDMNREGDGYSLEKDGYIFTADHAHYLRFQEALSVCQPDAERDELSCDLIVVIGLLRQPKYGANLWQQVPDDDGGCNSIWLAGFWTDEDGNLMYRDEISAENIAGYEQYQSRVLPVIRLAQDVWKPLGK